MEFKTIKASKKLLDDEVLQRIINEGYPATAGKRRKKAKRKKTKRSMHRGNVTVNINVGTRSKRKGASRKRNRTGITESGKGWSFNASRPGPTVVRVPEIVEERALPAMSARQPIGPVVSESNSAMINQRANDEQNHQALARRLTMLQSAIEDSESRAESRFARTQSAIQIQQQVTDALQNRTPSFRTSVRSRGSSARSLKLSRSAPLISSDTDTSEDEAPGSLGVADLQPKPMYQEYGNAYELRGRTTQQRQPQPSYAPAPVQAAGPLPGPPRGPPPSRLPSPRANLHRLSAQRRAQEARERERGRGLVFG